MTVFIILKTKTSSEGGSFDEVRVNTDTYVYSNKKDAEDFVAEDYENEVQNMIEYAGYETIEEAEEDGNYEFCENQELSCWNCDGAGEKISYEIVEETVK